MILKFRLKPEYWERAGLGGPNLFIKAISPKTGYQNFGIGELAKFKSAESSILSDAAVDTLYRRKQILILEEYTKETEEDDTNNEQTGLLDSGDSSVSSPII